MTNVLECANACHCEGNFVKRNQLRQRTTKLQSLVFQDPRAVPIICLLTSFGLPVMGSHTIVGLVPESVQLGIPWLML